MTFEAPQASLGQRIRAARKRAGLSQESLGQRVGVGRRTVIRWEKERDIPTATNREKLAHELGEDFTPSADDALTPLYVRLLARLEGLEDAFAQMQREGAEQQQLLEDQLDRLRRERGAG